MESVEWIVGSGRWRERDREIEMDDWLTRHSRSALSSKFSPVKM